MWSPWVSDHPIFYTIFWFALPNNRNHVVDLHFAIIRLNSTFLLLELIVNCYAACYRTVLEYFLLHIFCTRNRSLFLCLNYFRIFACKTIFRACTWWTHAVLTIEFTWASGIFRISCKLCLTRVVWDTWLLCKIINITWVSTVATVTRTKAIHYNLWGKGPILKIRCKYISTVSQSWSGALCPAWTALLGYVLLLSPW